MNQAQRDMNRLAGYAAKYEHAFINYKDLGRGVFEAPDGSRVRFADRRVTVEGP